MTAPLPPTLVLLNQVLSHPVPWIAEQRIRELRLYVPRAYAPWTSTEEQCLLACVDLALDVRDISLLLLRQTGAITVRLRQLSLPAIHQLSPVTPEDFIPTVLSGLFSTESPSLPATGLAYWVKSQRPRAGRPWTPTEDHCLLSVVAQARPIAEASMLFQRPWTEMAQQHQYLLARAVPRLSPLFGTADTSLPATRPG